MPHSLATPLPSRAAVGASLPKRPKTSRGMAKAKATSERLAAGVQLLESLLSTAATGWVKSERANTELTAENRTLKKEIAELRKEAERRTAILRRVFQQIKAHA